MRLLAALLALASPAMLGAEVPNAVPAQNTLIGPVLVVADPDTEVAFFREVFGMTLGMTLDGATSREYMLRFGDDPRAPGIILVAERDPAKRVAPVHGTGFSRVVLRTTDMAGIVARLDARGHPHPPVRDAAHGYSMLIITSPSGYGIEVVQSASRS